MTSFIQVNATSYIFATPPESDWDGPLITIILTVWPLLAIPKEMAQRRAQAKNKPQAVSVESEEPPERREATRKAKWYMSLVMISWLLMSIFTVIANAMFLASFYGYEDIVMNSIYSFWAPNLELVISFAMISFLFSVWLIILVGVNRHHGHDVSDNRCVTISVHVLLFVFAVVTLVSLCAFRPYCFPAFESKGLNAQCVADQTDTRIYNHRWVLFVLRIVVVLPLLALIPYYWRNLRPGTLGSTLSKLKMYRLMVEILLFSQLFLYLLQMFIEWVVVFYPRMSYSNYKVLQLVGNTVPNIVVLVGTIIMMKKIAAKAQAKEGAYQEFGKDDEDHASAFFS